MMKARRQHALLMSDCRVADAMVQYNHAFFREEEEGHWQWRCSATIHLKYKLKSI